MPNVLHFSAFIISYIELEFSESCNLHAHKQTESDISGMHEPKLLRSITRVLWTPSHLSKPSVIVALFSVRGVDLERKLP